MMRRVLLFGSGFIVAVIVGRFFVYADSGLSVFWPASGVLMWWALVAGSRREMAILAALVMVTITGGYVWIGFTLPGALLLGAANVVTPVVARVSARNYDRRAPMEILSGVGGTEQVPRDGASLARLDNFMDACRILEAGFLAVLANTVVGMSALLVEGLDPGLNDAVAWFFRNMAGSAVIAGCGLAISTYPRVRTWPAPRVLLEVIAGTLAVGGVVLWLNSQLSIGFALFLPLLWGAVRLPIPLAVGFAGITSLGAVSGVVALDGVAFGPDGQQASATAVLLFASLACGLSMMVSAALHERSVVLDDWSDAHAHVTRLFDDAPQGIAEITTDGRIILANASLAAKFGCAQDDLAGQAFESFSPRYAADFREHLESVLRASPDRVVSEWCLSEEDGDEVTLLLTSRMLPEKRTCGDTILIHVVDISERRQFESRLEYLANHDSLTGLANRRHFDQQLTDHMESFRRQGPDAALVILDLDHFKEVNDTFGHASGDLLLEGIGRRLRETVRSTDFVARIGGDEFAAIMPGADEEAAERVATDLITGIRQHAVELDGDFQGVTASAGVVTLSTATKMNADPLVLADMLMFDAKESSRDAVVMLDTDTGRQLRMGTRLEWKQRLEAALEQDRFVLHLQPVLDLAQNRIVAAEALIRLVSDDELILPGEFMAVAERSGLAPRIDAWVLRHGLPLLGRLRQSDPCFELYLNVSGQSMDSDEVRETFLRTVREHHIDARGIVMELTETSRVGDLAAAREFAAVIGRTGARFALDDFGSGFSTFRYLKNLEFDVVKIDGDYIVNLDTSKVDQAIVTSIVSGVHALGKLVAAELVGTDAVLERARQLEVDFAQGYGIGCPVPVEDFVRTYLGGAPQ